ncbi:MAG: hypothetical protein R3F37_13975 [Candidatus Competibacteraceae bacterium]
MLFLSLLMISIGAWAEQASAKKAAIALIGKAIAHIEAAGLEQALRDFQTADNAFQDGELYVFVYDFAGNNLANSVPFGFTRR